MRETTLSGQTADISPFVQHGSYNWIKYYDKHVNLPELKEIYGHWLGPSVGIGPAMTQIPDPGEQEL